MKIAQQDFDRIASMITSPDSPVGIDAKLTHVMILRKLEEIEHRLDRIETSMGSAAPPASGDEANQ